ncbi:MAG: DUF2721 domain-containing protein [Deltaproteobacteria bacterium]|nr:DUF2721 domain-containing protein [Deltaproteobacteria bacterium]
MNSDMTLGTPALLFPAISLLLLAYTNRFLALSTVVRGLHAQYQQNRSKLLVAQIQNLRTRLELIRKMQGTGVIALFLCVVAMFLLFAGVPQVAKAVFGVSLVMMMASLLISVREIQLSSGAMKIQLSDLEADPDQPPQWQTRPDPTDVNLAP